MMCGFCTNRLRRWMVAILMVLVGTGVLGLTHPPCEHDGVRTSNGVAAGDPNPWRADVATDLLTWRDWLEDGSFEIGTGAAFVLEHPTQSLATIPLARREASARTGGFGLRIEAGPAEGGILALRFVLEKGEQTRCTFWARSRGQSIDLPVSVLGAETSRASQFVPIHTPTEAYRVGTEWTQVQFTFSNTKGLAYAVLAIEVGPNQCVDLDDARIEAEQWKMADETDCTRRVGGTPVPLFPVAPVHFNVLIHIEDPALITQQEGYFREKTAVFSELARRFREHGGFLTIQPEEDSYLDEAL